MTGSTKTARFGAGVTMGVVTAVTALTFLSSHEAAFAKASKTAVVGRIESPLGLQGTRGAGGNVGVIFNLVDETRRKTDVEVQYGVDYNADGTISEDEYRIATEDRLDSRNTRKNKAPQLFTTAGDIGAAQQYVWKSLADVGTARLLTLEYALDPQGRPIPDPDNPGSFKFAVGPDGVTPIFAGVRVRVRAVRTQKDPVTGQKKKVYGDWAVSDSFGINNNNPPSMTIDSVVSNGVSVPTASDETVLLNWTAYDPDSEDFNGNGELDVADGEDINGNGKLDCERIGVAFDYHRLAANENPATMTADQIAALSWLPCTRKPGVGDTDRLLAQPGVPIPESGPDAGVCSAPPGVGRHWVFAWDSVTDVGTVYAKFVFRARPFDQKRENGNYAYMASPVQLDNWRIFHQGGKNFRVDELGSPRVGHTVTAILSQNSSTDPQDRGNGAGAVGFQEVLVAGGSNSVNGAAVTDLDRMQINLITAETTTVSRVSGAMQYARSGHTATALDDGRILIVGGFNAAGSVPQQTTEIYDPQTNTTVSGPNLIGARAKHTAVLLSSGDVAIFGGVGAGAAPLATCELIRFKPYQDQDGNAIAPSTWNVVALPNLAVAQYSALAALLPNQKVLVTGGVDGAGNGVTTAQLLDPLNDNDPSTPTTKDPIFTTIASPLSQARKFATATVLHDGNVLIAGGVAGGTAAASMEIYNWQFNQFEPVTTPMQVARAQHLALLLGDGSVLVAGGTSDPDAATPAVTGDADIVKIGTRDAVTAQWSASLQQVNGDLITARRLAAGATLDSGRVFLTGGAGATGTLTTSETYTPANGSNRGPRVRTTLPSSEQSYLYGAPIYYRLTDPEIDRARTVVQFIDRTATGDRIWHACSPLTNTIGGDIAEFTADLASTLTDDLSLSIDPVAHNTPGDHVYIWSLERDLPRPAPGQTASPYNVRVIPWGAVRGAPSESLPISVLFNTKIVPTILPFENYAAQRPDVALGAGALTPNQGGDVKIWVHLRDLDGGAPGTNGDLASCFFEYAIDKNNDGQIKDTDNEFFARMTPSGEPVAHALTPNPQTGLQTYYNAPADSDPQFGVRPAGEGWTKFEWDSVFDLGAPVTSFSNIWIRVTPSDANTGFSRIVRNLPGQPAALTIVKHPDSLYLVSWKPKYSNNKTAMPINDPIEFTFNGQILPSSVTSTTLQVWRGTGSATSQVRGQYTAVNNGNNTATVTFFPDAQSLLTGSIVYGQTAASTVLFPLDDYSFRIPGYSAGANPTLGTTVRPLTYANPPTVGSTYSTYRLAHVLPINAGALLNDPNFKFRTAAAGVYADDGVNVSNLTQTPAPVTTTLVRNAGQTGTTGVQLTFNRAIDPFTTLSPNITATLVESTIVNGVATSKVPVVPGRWTLTNVSNPDGSSSSTLQFIPLFQMPPTSTLQVAWTNGLKGFNGRPLTPTTFKWPVETYSRVSNSLTLESFTTTTNSDTNVTTALWGTDGCAAGALSGGTNGVAGLPSPTGGSALSIASGSTVTLTLTTNNYASITISKGGTLVLDSQSGPISVLSTGAISISGTVIFKGQDGTHGMHGYTSYPYVLYGPTTAGTRKGGLGRNGGGNGGDSTNTANNSNYTDAGKDGTDGTLATNSKGQGGQVPSSTATSIYSRYYIGAGGGAGGGNATAGLAGGRPCTQSGYTASAGYGAASTAGFAGGDAYFSNGVNGGGGGGGGGCCQYPGFFLEGGGGGAGAGACTIATNSTLTLTATGYIDGRGGNGGAGSHTSGSGGGGAGGSLRLLAKTRATLDGVIDLRGGQGGARGFAEVWPIIYSNATNEKTARYGGDGAPGRLLVLAPNYVSADEVRVYGQLIVKQIASLPTTALAQTSAPFGLDGNVATTTINFGSASAVRYPSLTVASGSTIDLIGSSNLQIFVDGDINIAGTLRLNGDSANPNGQNKLDPRTRFPNGQTQYYYPSITPVTDPSDPYYNPYPAGLGMQGNMGGGNGGNGFTNGSYANGREASNGTGPAPGVHNMNTSTGYLYSGLWNFYSGDSGASGGANATDGGDGWACYAVGASYNYLGAVNDSTGVGTTRQSGQVNANFPKRLALASTDPSVISNTNLSSFVGSGGGGGNSGGDDYSYYYGMAGIGGGGAGAVALMNTNTANSVTINGTIEARGGDGQTPGAPAFWTNSYGAYAHGGGGGGAGGTVYIASNVVSIGAVSTLTGTGGATFDFRGGFGGGYRSQNQYAGLQAYPEYFSTGAFGGNGGYGRLVIAVRTGGTLNNVSVSASQSGKDLANRWGMEQSSIDSASNTFKTLAGTARFYCPGLLAGGTVAQSKFADLKSLSPIVSSFVAGTVQNATFTLKVEGAQSLPNTAGAGGTGDADPSNTSGQFVVTASSPTPLLQGWRWFRWRGDFVKTTSSTGGAVLIDNLNIVYTSDF